MDKDNKTIKIKKWIVYLVIVFFLVMIVVVILVSAEVEGLTVTSCTPAGCSVAGLNTDNEDANDLIMDKGITGSVNIGISGSSGSDVINSVTLEIRHGGEAGVSDYIQADCAVETTGPSFTNQANTVTYCSCPANSVPNSASYVDHTCTPTSCDWTAAKLDDLAIQFCNDDGAGPSEAWIDYINITVDYSVASGSPCDCPGLGADFEVDLAEHCNLTDCDAGVLNFTGTGYATCVGEINTTDFRAPPSGGILYVNGSCLINE